MDLDLNARSEIFLAFDSLPLDQIDNKLRDVRTGEIWERFEFSKILLWFYFMPGFSKNQELVEDITDRF